MSFSPDGKQLASTGRTGNTIIWDLASRTPRASLPHTGAASSLDWHPAGRQVGIPYSDGTARIWRPSDGSYRVLRGHKQVVRALGFSPDGLLAATCSYDNTVRVWNVGDGSPAWWAPMMRATPVELCTRRGWKQLEAGGGAVPDRRWRRAVASRARRASEHGAAGLVCIAGHDDRLEIWDARRDKKVFARDLPGLSQVLALPGGCLVLARGKALLINRAGEQRELVGAGAKAIWRDEQTLLVAAAREVRIFAPNGAPKERISTDRGVTALARGAEDVVLGYSDGNLELVSARTRNRRKDLFFQQVPASAVEQILIGPRKTLFVGFADGTVGVWSAESGKRLHRGRLHGPVVHLLYNKGRLYAASELGSHLVWDLRVLELDYCEVMREVWRKVPILWKGGLPVLRKPPEGHRCKASK